MTPQDENIFTPFLNNHGFVVIDGALATELEQQGHDLRHPLWSGKLLLEDPSSIAAVHESYLEAGADCITTATYQISFAGGKLLGLDQNAVKSLLLQAVQLTDDAIAQFSPSAEQPMQPLIAASIGPYGAFLCDGSEYTGEYHTSIKQLIEFHALRWEILTESVADVIALETIPNIYEAEALRRLAEQFPEKPFWISFCCCDGFHLSDGHLITEAAQLFSDLDHVAAIGVNCTQPDYITSLSSQLRSLDLSQEIIVYPNSGESYDGSKRTWTAKKGEMPLPEWATGWFNDGARILGGCCRVGPQDIKKIRESLQLAK